MIRRCLSNCGLKNWVETTVFGNNTGRKLEIPGLTNIVKQIIFLACLSGKKMIEFKTVVLSPAEIQKFLYLERSQSDKK